LVWAAETKQGCDDSEALSTGADRTASELDARPLDNERGTFLAIDWAPRWLINAGFT